MRISDDRYNRDLRRYNLALRLIRHQARTDTINRWTGLSPFRIRSIVHTYAGTSAGNGVARLRGASPRSVSLFFRSPQREKEAAILGACCRMSGALPHTPIPDPTRTFPGVERGERLCEAFENFRVMFPDSPLTIEHAVLLALALARGDEVALGSCESCKGVIVVNRLEPRRPVCFYCLREAGASGQLQS